MVDTVVMVTVPIPTMVYRSIVQDMGVVTGSGAAAPPPQWSDRPRPPTGTPSPTTPSSTRWCLRRRTALITDPTIHPTPDHLCPRQMLRERS